MSQLKNDPSIRMAVHYLQDRIPELADKLQEGLNFVSEGTGGTKVTVSRKNGVWKTRGKQVFDNCLVIDSSEVPRYLNNTLVRHGKAQTEISACIERFQRCKDGQEFQSPVGDRLVKHEATSVFPQLTHRPMDDRVPSLIAYEFLALALGHEIFDSRFDAIRNCLRSGERTTQLQVVRKMTRQYTPDHRVSFRSNGNMLRVFVQFFRACVFEIRFSDIPLPSQEIVYIQDLVNRQGLLALSPKKPKRETGRFFNR